MKEICNLIDRALDGELYYDDYSTTIQELGVESIALDAVRGVHTCFMRNGTFFDHPLKPDHIYSVANTFSKEGVAAALAAFDSRVATASQFHKALTEAGVAYARCTYAANRAVYLSKNTDVYIETW